MKMQTKLRIALAHSGKTLTSLASEIGVSQPAVSMVLKGQRTSRRITGEIDRFIAREFKKLKIAVPHSTEGGPNDNNSVPTSRATGKVNSG